MHLLVILNVIFVSIVCANPVPPELTKCLSTDSKCLKSVTQAMIPKFASGLEIFNIKSLDPMGIEKVDASTPNLKLFLSNIKVTGLKDCTAKKIERDAAKKILSVTLLCNADVEGNYDMKGRLLVLPLEGNDKFQVKLNKAIFKVEGKYDVINKDGKTYWDIKSWDHAYKLQEKSSVHFENLFNGNKDLAKAAQDVIESNGNEIIDEVGPPVIKAIVASIVEGVQEFFHAIPAEDLALD
ncbi:circadian clock-controlled protein daywake-like [Pieris brassicae]|uniref:circadian clock-controlled protein daywake-like n=1 Tax=Pieris brassicae TaxID=7116 RepID=UPI001E65EEEB|nr:circadian clock-controlled protein daywake-like [Pieris brassicae]